MSPAKKALFYWITVYCYIFLAWNYYHMTTRFPGWVDEILFKPFVELLPILFVVFMVEKDNWKSLGFTGKNLLKHIQTGLIAGIVLITSRYLVKVIMSGGIVVNPHHLSIMDFAFFAITSVVVGFLEETIFRGFFFQRLLWISKNEVLANIITSCMFALSHMPFVVLILHYSSGDLFFYAAQIIFMGIVFAFLFARNKSIVPSITAHTIWKFSNVFFI